MECELGTWNVITGPCNVIMGTSSVNRELWNVNKGPCNVIIGPRNVIMGPWNKNR